MATFLREALRKPSHLKFLATCPHQKPVYPPPPHIVQSTPLGQPRFEHHRDLLNPDSISGLPFALNTNLPPFPPSFSLSYFLNPNADQFGSIDSAVVNADEGLESDDSKTIRADSVKKKRKKKMNKHKYKKLRKSLRLKS